MSVSSTHTPLHRGLLAALVPVLLAVLIGLAPTPSEAQQMARDPAYNEFYQALDPHGEWVVHPRYGETWVPYANEDREWRPYSRGQWLYTEEHGWLWDSEEPFGWVVYHHGRWLLDQRHGWMWVPGTEWAPAWVAWREGADVIGWAPLPPEAEFDGSGELTYQAYASPRYAPMWIFVAPAMLAMPAVYRYFHPRARSTFYFGQTRHATYYGYRDRRIYNRGIDRRFIEMRAQRPVPVIQIRPLNTPRDHNLRRFDGSSRQVGIYRPQIVQPVRPPAGAGGQPAWRGPAPQGNDPARQRPPFAGDGARQMPPQGIPPGVNPVPRSQPAAVPPGGAPSGPAGSPPVGAGPGDPGRVRPAAAPPPPPAGPPAGFGGRPPIPPQAAPPAPPAGPPPGFGGRPPMPPQAAPPAPPPPPRAQIQPPPPPSGQPPAQRQLPPGAPPPQAQQQQPRPKVPPGQPPPGQPAADPGAGQRAPR